MATQNNKTKQQERSNKQKIIKINTSEILYIKLFDINFIQQKISQMKGIQINNFFNNHISLNAKKNPTKQPNIFSQSARPQPINQNDLEPEQMSSFDALTPQMKGFAKDPILSTRKKRTNTIEPQAKARQNKKSKTKKYNSQQKLRKTVSLDKCNQKDISVQQDISKTLTKNFKKPKTSRSKNQQSEGVKRSKSAIIKNTHSKASQPKQISKNFLKQQKKNNIISADSSFKDASKRQIKKQTQNLINKKQTVQKVECKTARVHSTKVKSRKNKDKIIAEINKSSQKDDKKSIKFLTQRKTTGTTVSKSYLTSAKQSKPNSARDKKPSKKLFDSKQKDYYRIEQDQVNTYTNLEDFIKDSGKQDNYEVRQALNELQSVLQGISSKKDLAKQLKKFTFKLKQYPSKSNSDQNEDSNSQQESNSEAFKRIKDFKNNLVKKKLNQGKQVSKQQQNQTHRQHVSSKKSSKKLLKAKKKLQEPQKQIKKQIKKDNINENEGQVMQSWNTNNETSQPEDFKNTQQEESKYINSRNVSQFYEKNVKDSVKDKLSPVIGPQHDQSGLALNATNKKYMQFLKNLQAESQNDSQNNQDGSSQKLQKDDQLIQEINLYMNKQYLQIGKEYNSEKPKDSTHCNYNNSNPLLERRAYDGYLLQTNHKDDQLNNYLSEHSDQNSIQKSQNQNQSLQDPKINKLSQIQQLKSFQKLSDQMMNNAGINIKLQQKKKNLTIQLNSNNNNITELKTESKTPSSPKYDDRYPHMVKSPKFSDIQITNILAAKQKCLASKHKKMNELIQKMYEKQLVSPKSYEYFVYQLKKRYQEESEGFDGFKEQASQILNEINQEKNDIKAIDELIREQKWDEARKLMKGDHRAASSFFGFKKSKDKIFEAYESRIQEDVSKQASGEVQKSPSKKSNIAVIQNNISITIKPQGRSRQLIKELEKEEKKKEKQQASLKRLCPNTSQEKGGVIDQSGQIEFSQSGQDSRNGELFNQSITKRLEFEFEEKYKLKSNDDQFISHRHFGQQAKLQSELDSYLNDQKADSEDFEHYVYYQGDQNQRNQASEHILQTSNNQLHAQKLKPQGVFKLFQVPLTGQDQQDDNRNDSESDTSENYQRVTIESGQNTNQVIKIDEQQPPSHQNKNIINIHTISKSPQQQTQKIQHVNGQDDNQSQTGSILQLQLRKGFESNLFFIKEYCISLCEYIRDNAELKNKFKDDISQPLQFQIDKLLKKYRFNLDGSYSEEYNSTLAQLQYKNEFRKPPNKAITLQLAQQFNKSYVPLKFWNKDLTKKGREKFNMEKQAEKIFLQAILEVLNQSLDFQRPGSIFGRPLAWANKSKHLKNMKYLHGQKTKKVIQDSQESAETYDFIFGVAIARIIQWGSCLCGFLPDTAQLQNTQIDDDYVVHIRETRMAFLLQKMLAEQEVTFNNSQLQETEIMLYLGRTISQELAEEAAEELVALGLANSFNELTD